MVKRIQNFNYIFLFYDIKEERVQKVFKVCKKYLFHHQMSVFRGPITPSKFLELKSELEKVINKKEDFISVIMLLNEKSYEEESIGTKKKDAESLFL